MDDPAAHRAVAPSPFATLHLFGVPTAAAPVALARMALDRRHLARQPGLRFFKLLGTGTGETFTLRDADHRRWGLFAVWDGPGALAAFEAGSRPAVVWDRISVERWRGDLVLLRSRGRWSGRSPFDGVATSQDGGGPVAALTRARIAVASSRAFWRAVPPVSADLHRSAGVLLAVGVGEAPFGLQGTFSLWRSSQDLAAYAYRGAPHRRAIAETAARRWYAEELFARFEVIGSHGTVGGRDPLAPVAGDA